MRSQHGYIGNIQSAVTVYIGRCSAVLSDRFHTLYVARSLIKLWCICIELTLLKKFAQISPLRILKGSWRYLVVSLLMGVLGYALLRLSENVIWQVGSVFICIVFYFGVLYFIPRTRETLLELKKMAVARKLGPD